MLNAIPEKKIRTEFRVRSYEFRVKKKKNNRHTVGREEKEGADRGAESNVLRAIVAYYVTNLIRRSLLGRRENVLISSNVRCIIQPLARVNIR